MVEDEQEQEVPAPPMLAMGISGTATAEVIKGPGEPTQEDDNQ